MEKVERKRFMNKNWEIPPHIVQVIFSKLPFSYLPTCRIVSKTWNDLVIDYASSCKSLPQAFLLFTSERIIPDANHPNACRYANPKIHSFYTSKMTSIASSRVDSDSLRIFGSTRCNGLVFITKDFGHCDHSQGILNPMTNEFFKLPPLDNCYIIGFGFSPKTNQYKLFRLPTDPSKSSCVMEIFRLGRNGTNQWNRWNRLKRLPFNIHYNGAYLNGVVYWIGKDNVNKRRFAIYALDVETEQIERILTLDVGTHNSRGMIETFNGSIYVTIFTYEPSRKLQVLKMQDKDSWIKKFVIDDIPNDFGIEYFRIMKTFEYGAVLFLVNGDLFCLDTTGKKAKMKTLYPEPLEVSLAGQFCKEDQQSPSTKLFLVPCFCSSTGLDRAVGGPARVQSSSTIFLKDLKARKGRTL